MSNRFGLPVFPVAPFLFPATCSLTHPLVHIYIRSMRFATFNTASPSVGKLRSKSKATNRAKCTRENFLYHLLLVTSRQVCGNNCREKCRNCRSNVTFPRPRKLAFGHGHPVTPGLPRNRLLREQRTFRDYVEYRRARGPQGCRHREQHLKSSPHRRPDRAGSRNGANKRRRGH